MRYPMTDLKLQYASIKNEIDAAVATVLKETNFILGSDVSLLEKEVAGYMGVRYARAVASCTDALVLALLASGIKQGDEVITTPFTFIATAEAIERAGAKIVFCDIDPATLAIDPASAKGRITGKTKAILPVHLYGLPCDMDAFLSLGKTNGLRIIEDCAQSFGSVYKGKKVGSLGTCGCFSFFPAKTLGCYGDGGMVITDDKMIDEKLASLRNHGSTEKYYYSLHGLNSRLDTLQAAILRVKLKHIDPWIERRITCARLYNRSFSGIAEVVTPAIPDNATYAFNYYTLRIRNNKRETVHKHLADKGIASAIYYPLSLHLQEVYKGLGYRAGDFPAAEAAQQEVLSLPLYPELSEDDVTVIAQEVRQALGA